jgi:hypothetical protein
MAIALAGCGRINIDAHDDSGSAAACIHTFCDDFDRAPPADRGWTGAVVAGGTLALDSSESVSPPSSLLTTIAFPSTAGVYLTKDLPVMQTALHASLDIELATTTLDAEIDLFQIVWVAAPQPCTAFGYFLVRDSTNVMVMQETYVGCGTSVNDILPFPAGFHHVVVDIAAGAIGTATVRIEIDGVLALDKQVDHAIPASALTIALGAPGVRATTGPWLIRYDNLIVDVL